MSKIQFLVLMGSTVLFLSSCGKETQSSTQGGGTFRVRATIVPTLKCGKNAVGLGNLFIIIMPGLSQKLWNGGSETVDLNQIQTDEISVTSGQNISTSIQIGSYYLSECKMIKVEGIQNGKVIKTMNYQMGQTDSGTMCKDATMQTANFIIE